MIYTNEKGLLFYNTSFPSVVMHRAVELVRKGMTSDTSAQFVYDFPDYLTAHEKSQLVNQSSAMLAQLIPVTKTKPAVRSFEDIKKQFPGLTVNFFVDWMLLSGGVASIVDLETMKPALYTRNVEVLKSLVESGHTTFESVSDPKYIKLLENLYKTKTLNGLKENTLFAVRIDVKAFGKNYLLDLKAPRSRLDLKNIACIPVEVLYAVSDTLVLEASGSILKVRKVSGSEVITHVVTSNEDVLRREYKGVQTTNSDIEDRISLLDKAGYDVLRGRLLLFDLESSVESLGEFTVMPHMLDWVKQTSSEGINRSLHGLQSDIVEASFESYVKGFKSEQFDAIRFFDLSSYNTVEDKREALLGYAGNIGFEELYNIMLRNRILFPDVNKKMQNMQHAKLRVFKNFVVVQPAGKEFTSDEVRTALKAGSVKMVIRSKTGGYKYRRIASLNSDVLEKVYGGVDVCMKMESPVQRIKYVRTLISFALKNESPLTPSKLESLISEYDVGGFIYETVGSLSDTDYSDRIASAKVFEALNKAYNDQITVIKSRDNADSKFMVTYRNLQARNKDTYIQSADVRLIEALYVSRR